MSDIQRIESKIDEILKNQKDFKQSVDTNLANVKNDDVSTICGTIVVLVAIGGLLYLCKK